MNLLLIGALIALLIMLYDRLRLINWHTVRPEFVALYLLQVMWALSVFYDAARDAVAWHQCIGVFAQALWLYVTRTGWLGGVPENIKTRPADLGPPEVERLS